MRVLLDECVDHRLGRELEGHQVSTVARMGWQGKANGELLALPAQHFDVFLTTDRNLSFRQNLPDLDLAALVLHGRTNRLDDLRALTPELPKILPFVQPGQTRQIGRDL